MNTKNFAITYERLVSDSFSVKKEARKVLTKQWCKQHHNSIHKFVDSLYIAGRCKRQTLKAIIISGYGFNIGEQIWDKLSEDDHVKLEKNIKDGASANF